jgi:hypothetical protein
MSFTFVSCFFDINREHKGDGRSIQEYVKWIEQTLKLNANLYIVTEKKFESFFREHMHSNTVLKIIDFSDLHYYKYYKKMCDIISSESFKNKIKHPTRVECILPEYNIIQYSKFHVLDMAIKENPFKSDFFFWIDAGISRFFLNVDISKSYPGPQFSELVKQISNQSDKFFIQSSATLEYYPIDENFIWDSMNLLSGGMFGGNANAIKNIGEKTEEIFQYMLSQNCMNNEQLALAMVWKNNPELFFTIRNVYGQDLPIFTIFSN